MIDPHGEERTGAPIDRLKKRPDFLRAAKGRKAHSALFTVQCIPQVEPQHGPARAGFTVTKKVGGAVERNRMKRRLRELVRTTPDLAMKLAHDYVIVARREVLSAAAPTLGAGLKAALRKLNTPAAPRADRQRAGRQDAAPATPQPSALPATMNE